MSNTQQKPEALRLATLIPSLGVDAWSIEKLHQAAAQLRRLHAENELLRGSLKKANDQAEHFEREWYLRGDENEALRKDAERFRFANDSEEDFAICYWDESMGNGGEWMCNGHKGLSIDLLDAAIAKAAGSAAMRCPLCNYQHGHAIGCANNPVDQALARIAIAKHSKEQNMTCKHRWEPSDFGIKGEA